MQKRNGPIHVLLVEDNPDDARMAREMLSATDMPGFSVEHANRISVGLDRLSKNAVDVILLDLDLPDSHGLDTLQNIFLVAPKVPVVVISSLDNEELALQAVQGGAQDYLVKGRMDPHILARAIRYAIERNRSEEELHRVNRALKTLSECNQALVRATDERSFLHEICETLIRTGGYRMAWVGFAERDEAKTVRPVAYAGYDEGYLAGLNVSWADTERGRGPTGTAIRSGKLCKANDLLTNPSYAPWRASALERGYAASIALPLRGSRGPFGALNIYARETDAFDEQEARLLQELADDMAYGILALRTRAERAQAVDLLQKSEEQYRLLFDTMLSGFALHEVICDENGAPCDYRFLEINPSFERMTGLKAAEIVGKTARQVIPDLEPSWIARYGEVALTGQSTRFENYVHPLKKYFDVLAFSPRKDQFATIFTDITERKLGEKVREAVYKISQTSVSADSLDELFGSIHAILGELMPVDNFFIALYDPASDLLSFPYFVDQYDQPGPPVKPGRGLTEYILRTGNSLLASPEVFAQLVRQGEVELVGTDSVDWLGVPLKARGQVFGVMVTQSYTEGIRFREEEKDLLEFVSTQVALVVDRKRAEEALRESEEGYRILVDNTPDFIYSLDREGRYTAVNRSLCRAMNLPHEAIIGKNHRDLELPEALVQEWDEMHGRVLVNGEVVKSEVSAPMPDGRLRVYTVSLRPIKDPEGQITGIRGVRRDISEQKDAEQEIRRQLDRLAALRRIDSAINSNLDMHQTLNTILVQIIAQLNIDAANVLLLDPHNQVLEYVVGRGFRTDALQHTRLYLGDSYAGRAALGRRIVRISDLRDRKTDFLRSPTFYQEGFESYLGVPLIAKSEVKGVLEIFHRSPLNPDTEWLNFMETLANQAAIAIDNNQLFESLQRSNLELKRAYDATIEGWSQAMDLRDRETEGHSLRVTELTLRLARAMGMDKDELVHIRRGALLHDMGKLGVPDDILFKPSELSGEEWTVMKQHPRLAYDMLSPIKYLRPALDIPYCHHEKWDGSGYPRGLKGEQIPLAARIFAVADVWDALSSDRPYRPAWQEDKIREYILAQSGAHFDPAVVQAFMQLIGEAGGSSGGA